MTNDAAAMVPVDADREVRALYVVFKVEGSDYALPAALVQQIESYGGATPVPGARPFVLGVLQLRGKVVPVVDLRARFGLPPAERTLDTRVVVVDADGRTVALVADSAREVVHLAPSQLTPPPKLVDDGAAGFVREVARLGARTLMVLDFAKVVGEQG